MSEQLTPDSNGSDQGCDVCGEVSARELYSAVDRLGPTPLLFTIAQCRRCGVMRTLPEMTEKELAAFYPSDYWGDIGEPDPNWIRSSQSAKVKFLRSCRKDRGRILDVGCGSGWFLRALDGSHWDCFGIETGREARQLAAATLGKDRISGDTLLDAALPAAHFDVVTFWSALEHMNHPRGTLEAARRVVKDGGTVIVQVPNAAGYQTRLFKANWFAFDVPRHRYHFTADSLHRLLTETGFEPFMTTTYSQEHNAHALRQSLKTTLQAAKSWRGYLLFCLTIPLIKPVDWFMTSIGSGATITVAARAV